MFVQFKTSIVPFYSKNGFTLTRCRSMGFIIVPWKNSTVVKWRLNSPSNSKSGGLLISFFLEQFVTFSWNYIFCTTNRRWFLSRFIKWIHLNNFQNLLRMMVEIAMVEQFIWIWDYIMSNRFIADQRLCKYICGFDQKKKKIEENKCKNWINYWKLWFVCCKSITTVKLDCLILNKRNVLISEEDVCWELMTIIF